MGFATCNYGFQVPNAPHFRSPGQRWNIFQVPRYGMGAGHYQLVELMKSQGAVM